MNSLITVNQVEQSQDDFVNAIIESKGTQLPATIQEIIPILEFSKARMTAFKALSDAASKVSEQQALNDAALASGQRWGIVHLYGQKKLGELTRDIPKTVNQYDASPSAGKPKGKVLEDQKMNFRHVAEAERIARNPEILDQVIETAKERGEIPTKTAVLNTIRVEEMRKRDQERVKKSHDRLENERDDSVSEFYEGLKAVYILYERAIIAAERGKFDSAGKNFLIKKNNKVKELIQKLEELV